MLAKELIHRTEDEIRGELTIQEEEIEPIVGLPKLEKVKVLRDNIEDNLIGFDDTRDPTYGKLHLIKDTSKLDSGPSAVVPASTNQGAPDDWDKDMSEKKRVNYMLKFVKDQQHYLKDQLVENVLKKIIINKVEKPYLAAIKHRQTQFKGVSLKKMIQHLIETYPIEPKARATIEAELKYNWNRNNHIEEMYEKLIETLTLLAEIDGVADAKYTDADFIYNAYLIVEKTGRFSKAVTTWEAKAATDKATEKQFRKHFDEAYLLFTKKQE